jgi:Uma2 family endonuclease
MAIVERRMTAEEFLKLREQRPSIELIDGKVVQKPSGQEQHGWLQSILSELFNAFGRRRKLAAALTELRGRFGEDVLLPDVAVYRWERLPRTPEGELANVYQGPPDIAVEIVSPDQTIREMVHKGRRYLTNGVQIVLVVYPKGRSVTLMRPGGDPKELRGGDRIDLDTVLPGFELTVQELFDTLRLD